MIVALYRFLVTYAIAMASKTLRKQSWRDSLLAARAVHASHMIRIFPT